MPIAPFFKKNQHLNRVKAVACCFYGWWSHPKRRILRRASTVLGALFFLPYLLTLFYVAVNPPFATITMWRGLQGENIQKTWVDFENISPHLVKAVITSEDSRFCAHNGVDWGAVGTALDEEGSSVRGASTITMQVAKNLFLWPSRSYIRKAIEVPLAYWIDLIWSKRRIVEVYLNIVEWGPGIFGAESAANYHFSKKAKTLSAFEASLLAASLPNPHIRIAGKPGPRTSKVGGIIRTRMPTIEHYLKCLK